jgi:hypothetical protein
MGTTGYCIVLFAIDANDDEKQLYDVPLAENAWSRWLALFGKALGYG